MSDLVAFLGKSFLDGVWSLFDITVPGFNFTFGGMWLGFLLASLSVFTLCTVLILTVPASAVEWDDYRYWNEEYQCWSIDVFSYSIAKAEEELLNSSQQPDSPPAPRTGTRSRT